MASTIPSSVFEQGGSFFLTCSGNGPVYGGELIGFCAFVQVNDAVSGNQTTENNTQTDDIYDACGNHIGSGQTFGWHIVGQTYFETAETGSQLFTVPSSGVCWGTWSETYTFTQTFTDGQTLTASLSDSFPADVVNPAPPTAYGYGQGDASVHNPTCSSGDPVNCASGNFSETFTDTAVPGRGPSLDLTRTYNSLSASTPGIFGYGWTSSYEAHLTLNNDGSATVTEADGSQVTGVPAGGNFTIPAWADSALTHNSDGTWTFVRQQSTTYTFNTAGQLTSITDRNGYPTALTYNGSSQLTAVTDPAGRAITFSYGTNGFVSQVTDPANQVTSYGYDANGNLTSVADPMTRTTSFGYDTSHLLQTLTDPNQGVTTNVYDTSGRVTQQTDPANLVTRFAYNGDNFSTSGGTTTITDPHGNTTIEHYTSGVMLSITKGSGTPSAGTWTYSYDPNTFGAASVTDPNGHVTTSSYDSSGNLLRTTDPLNHTTTYTYNTFNEPLTMTDPAGITTTYTYDTDGNLLTKTVTGAGGAPAETTTYSYGDGHAGDITEITDPAGHVSDYTYDSQGDVASTTTHPSNGVNDTTSFVYDTLGNKVCEASPNATAAGIHCSPAGQPRVTGTTTLTYNADNELTSGTDPLGNVTAYSYDADGNQTQVSDPAGHVTKTTFDPDSRKLTITTGYGSPDASTTAFAYDIAPGTSVCSNSVTDAAYCTSTTDPAGQATVSYFNSRAERIRQSQPSSGPASSAYDPAGNLTTRTTNGGTATYGYDAADELTSITYSSPASGYTVAANVSYSYDADGQRTSMSDATGTTSYSYDSLERLASVTSGAGATISYQYDLDNQVTSISYPGRNQTVTQTYDGAERESSMTDWLSHTTSFSYDADGNLTAQRYPNSTTATSTYDTADNLLTTTDAPNSNPANPLASFTYTLNPDSRVQSEADSGTPNPSSQSYAYDQLDRLTSTSSGAYAYNTSSDPTQLPGATQAFSPVHQVTRAAATITRVGTASAGDNGTGSTLALTLPSGVAANDQILLAVTLPGNQSVKSTPSGYTLIGSYSSGTTASSAELVLYRRTAQTGDTSVTVTFSKTFAKAAAVVVYRGVNPVTPIDVTSSGTAASSQSVTTPPVTTTKDNDELVIAESAESSTAGTWTAPSQMTARVSQAGGPSIAGALADQSLGAAGSTGSRTATFSVTGSLAAALVSLQPAQNSYGYDSLGDRTSVTAPGGTTTPAYNQIGQMTSYGATAYTYNGDGLRASKTTGHTTTSFVWQPAGPTTPGLLLTDGSTDYVYGPGGLPLEQINGSTVLYYLHDQLGSTRVLTSSTGAVAATYTYGAYGNLTASTGTVTNPFTFAGGYTDPESGLMYLQHRYYDPATAQFTSVDPLVDTTGAPYAYAAADPINSIDPTGLGFLSKLESFGHALVTFGSDVIHDPVKDVEFAATVTCIVLSDGICLEAVAEASLVIDTAHNVGSAFQNGFSLCALGHFARSEALTAGEDLAGEGAGRILKGALPESLAGHTRIDESSTEAPSAVLTASGSLIDQQVPGGGTCGCG